MKLFNKGSGQGHVPPGITPYTLNNPDDPWNLDNLLLNFTDSDPFTFRDACEGVQIFGGIGSGKTSGSGAALARAFLLANFGGLVCCAKPEERELWQRYAAETGRSKHLVIVRPGERGQLPPWRFNFLEYELNRASAGGGQTENVVNLLYSVVEIVRGKQSEGEDGSFWVMSGRELISNAVDLLAMAGEPLSLDNVCKIIVDAPQTPTQAYSEEWRTNTYSGRCMVKADLAPKTARQAHDFEVMGRYWLDSFSANDPKTRANITATVNATISTLSRGLAWELLCNDPALTNVIPEATYTHGAIIVLDLSVQEYREAGRIVQGVWKRLFQEVLLRRKVSEHPRPVFLWADESQHFVTAFDREFIGTARSARCAMVYLTQNVSNYLARLGHNAKADADSLLGTFGTKIFHSQSDTLTNQYAADLIGKEITGRRNQGASGGGGDGSASFNVGSSESLEYIVQPAEFSHLTKGGPQNNGIVTAIIHQTGKWWNEGGIKRTGGTFLLAAFTQ